MKKLVVCLLLVGCGGDDDSGGGNGSVALDDLGTELASVSCSKQFECCTDAELMAQYMGIEIDGHPVTTEADCNQFANGLLTSFLVAEYKESLAAGRIEYNGAAAADCIAALDGVTCGGYSASLGGGTVPISCQPFVIPKVAEGGACGENYECTTGNCVGAQEGSNGEPDVDGTCMPMPTMGQECTDSCAEGLYCAFGQTGTRTCQPLKDDGAECTLDRECKSENCDDTTDVCGSEPPVCDGR